MQYVLLTTVFLPVAGAAIVGVSRAWARYIALATAILVFLLTAVLVAQFPVSAGAFALTDVSWLGWDGSPRFSIALDGLSLWLFALTSLLMVVSVLVSWEAIRERVGSYYALLLALETGMLGVFVARDVILFYIFFEFTLLPLFFLIGIWGSEERRYAANKFFVFTLAGSVLTFLALLTIVLWNAFHTGITTFSIPELIAGVAPDSHPIRPLWLQVLIFLGLFAGFAIKVPLFPLHTWLPLAHVQAPTAGSVILAGVLLKVGTYGFVRLAVPMLPAATAALMPWLLWLSVAGIVYGALVALAQADMKRLIAYSSVSHLGFCMLGVFALNRLGMQGGVLQMVNHGLSTGGLFAVIGMLYERYHTRQIKDMGGLARRLPLLATFMLVLTLSSIGLPGLNGFAGEFPILLGMFQRAQAEAPAEKIVQFTVIAVLATSGVVLGAWYMLSLVQRIFFGPLREPIHELHEPGRRPPIRDMSPREVAALTPLVVFIVWIGVWPDFFLSRMAPTLDQLAHPAIEAARPAEIGTRAAVASDETLHSPRAAHDR